MTDLIPIQDFDFNWSQKQVVDARILYDFLGARKSNFLRWHNKYILNNEFAVEWEDYIIRPLFEESSNDCLLAVDFAKKLAMIVNTPKWEQVRQYFINTEKALKKVIEVVKPRTTIEMLEEAVIALKAKDREVLRLETTNRQLNNTNARIYSMKAKDTKTGLKALKDDTGAEINMLVNKFYSSRFWGDHASMHREAWNDYFLATNIVYSGATRASLKSKQDFLAWLNHGSIGNEENI